MARKETHYLDTKSNYATGINDLQFEKNIKEQKSKQAKEAAALERFEKKEARREKIKEYKQNTVPIYKVKKSFIIAFIICIILGLVALFNGFIIDAVFSIIAGIGSMVLGQNMRIGNSQPKLTNTILYNIHKSFKDFIDYKIPYEIFENEKSWMDMYTVLGMLVFIALPSKNIFYGLAVVMILITFLIAFANNDTKGIYNHAKLVVPACFIGLIVKVVYNYIYMGTIDIDLANVVLINLFATISAYTKELEITKPQ